MDDKGVGHAVYQARGLKRTYSLIAFAHDPPDEHRTDRVIATAWDATFTLFDGVPSEGDIIDYPKCAASRSRANFEKNLSVTCKPLDAVV